MSAVPAGCLGVCVLRACVRACVRVVCALAVHHGAATARLTAPPPPPARGSKMFLRGDSVIIVLRNPK